MKNKVSTRYLLSFLVLVVSFLVISFLPTVFAIRSDMISAAYEQVSGSADSHEDIDIPEASDDIEIDYNILEKKMKFELGETSALTGGPPQGSWVSGSANGLLNIENRTPEIYQNFSFEGNTVSGKTPPVTVNPLIHTTLRREDFGDDPRVLIYGNTNAKTGEVRGSGSVSAEYTWKVTYRDCDTDDDGKRHCTSYTVTYYGNTSGPFSSYGTQSIN